MNYYFKSISPDKNKISLHLPAAAGIDTLPFRLSENIQDLLPAQNAGYYTVVDEFSHQSIAEATSEKLSTNNITLPQILLLLNYCCINNNESDNEN